MTEQSGDDHAVRWWLMCGYVWSWRFIRAEGPCWKGEIRVGPFTLGWQRKHGGA